MTGMIYAQASPAMPPGGAGTPTGPEETVAQGWAVISTTSQDLRLQLFHQAYLIHDNGGDLSAVCLIF